MDIDSESHNDANASKHNDILDCSKFNKKNELTLDFLIKTVKRRFVTGAHFEEQNAKNDGAVSDDDSIEAKKKKKQNDQVNEKQLRKDEHWKKDGEENNEGDPIINSNDKQEEKNLIKDFCNEDYGIFEKGTYVRIDIKTIKKKYVDHFKTDFPIILCTTNLQENSFGFLKIKFTKHLWHPKILKNNDPIILSIGWRKFQVTPIYCIEEKNHRLRMIKYTPKYTSCYAICYGPLMPINVAAVAIQNYNENVNHFRICGTGDLIEINQNFDVNKKLKLIGEPFEIYKKTAFIKGMFNSNVI